MTYCFTTVNIKVRSVWQDLISASINVSLDPHISSAHASFVLRFYGPVNQVGSCRARLVYLITRLLSRLSPLSS